MDGRRWNRNDTFRELRPHWPSGAASRRRGSVGGREGRLLAEDLAALLAREGPLTDVCAAGRPGRPLAVGPAAGAALGRPVAGVAARVLGELHVLAKGLAA